MAVLDKQLLVIAGFPKCGTSSVFRWFADHPGVCGSQIKETCFFSDRTSHTFNPELNYHDHGLEAYSRCFGEAGAATVYCESTPTYAYSDTAIQQLEQVGAPVKLVFFVRDPADQIYSTFRYFQNNWQYLPAQMTFADFLRLASEQDEQLNNNELCRFAIENARWSTHLERWRAVYGDENMKVVDVRSLKLDSARVMQELASWVGLDPAYYANYGYPLENETYQVRSDRLQSFNLKIRPYLVDLPGYAKLRAVYRRMNTTSRSSKAPQELDLQDELRDRFEADNNELARDWHLDVSAWKVRG